MQGSEYVIELVRTGQRNRMELPRGVRVMVCDFLGRQSVRGRYLTHTHIRGRNILVAEVVN